MLGTEIINRRVDKDIHVAESGVLSNVLEIAPLPLLPFPIGLRRQRKGSLCRRKSVSFDARTSICRVRVVPVFLDAHQS